MKLVTPKRRDRDGILVGRQCRERVGNRALSRLGEDRESSSGLGALTRGEALRIDDDTSELDRTLARVRLCGPSQRLDREEPRVTGARERTTRSCQDAPGESLARFGA